MESPARFETKAEAKSWIETTKGDIADYFTTTFVSNHYAGAYGVEEGGWYVVSITAGQNTFETLED